MQNKNTNNDIALILKKDFEVVYHIISLHRNKVIRVVNNESLLMMWEIGGFVSSKIESASWGDGVVRQLAEFIHTQDPTARGWSYRTLYKMVQFYETYSSESFKMLISKAKVSSLNDIVPLETAQNDNPAFVPFEMAQMPKILFCTGWTNHQIILNRCKTDQERLFYILYTGRERLQNKELIRAIKTNVMDSLLGGKSKQSDAMAKTYPTSPILFKEKIYLDMLGLPLNYKESKLRKEIVKHMKDFILELGKDFLFIDEEHRITVGGKTFKIDLLFYHRLLQCMVAIELKTTEFHPKDLGQ